MCFAAFVLAVAASVAAHVPLRTVDIMPSFWRVWDGSYVTQDARTRAFREQVIDPNRDAYANAEFDDELRSEKTIASYFTDVRPYIPSMRVLDRRINAEIEGDIEIVRKKLPDFDLTPIDAVYVMPSLLRFNGQYHGVGGKVGLYLGVDGIARYNGEHANIGVLVAHELFHIYQLEKYGGDEAAPRTVWQAVWIEGSAAYASQYLAAHGNRADALGPDVASASPALVRKVACRVQQTWASTADRDIDSLLDVDMHPAGLPARGGYLVGYLAAAQLAKTMNLREIGGALNDPAFERKLRPIVRDLCRGKHREVLTSYPP